MKDKSENTNQAETVTTKTTASAPTSSTKKKGGGAAALSALTVVVLGAVAFWYVQSNHTRLSQKYDTQLQSVVAQSHKNEQLAQQALQLVQNQTQQIQQLSQQLSQTKDQLSDVSLALQNMSDTGTDLMLLNDVEQLVILAQQQLLIGGNLANAIVSLETAQARLSHANRQSLAVLIQTINGDLDRLRTAQVVDVATVTAQLERLSDLLSKAPLYVPDSGNSSINPEHVNLENTTAIEPLTKDNSDAAWWERTLSNALSLTQKGWETISQDLGQFVSVRRVDDSAALLMSIDQADRFRENLRLRVTLAQLALLTKQPKVWEAEMNQILTLIEQRFDPSLAITQRTLSLATQLADTQIDVKLPSIDNTLAAIENLKQADQNKLSGKAPERTEAKDINSVPEHIEPNHIDQSNIDLQKETPVPNPETSEAESEDESAQPAIEKTEQLTSTESNSGLSLTKQVV